MYKLIRFYNQNRRKILITILIIVFILGIIQLLNYFSKINVIGKETPNITVNNAETNQGLVSDKSAISGQSVSSTKLEKDTKIIGEFVEYCNKGDINSAYGILTNECKENMFPTIEDFNNIYYSKLFDGYKTYTIENWNGNTYQVRFTGDILSTGDLSNNVTKQDYITVVKKDEETKLNINNYVGRTNSNKVTEYKNIKVTVKNIDTYMDYETYNLSIQNNSENTILLDTSDDTKSVYLLDSKDMKYYFYSNEIIENRLIVKSKFTNNLEIKFSNSYSSSRSIEKLVFSKLVLNYDEYKILENKEGYEFNQFRINI